MQQISATDRQDNAHQLVRPQSRGQPQFFETICEHGVEITQKASTTEPQQMESPQPPTGGAGPFVSLIMGLQPVN